MRCVRCEGRSMGVSTGPWALRGPAAGELNTCTAACKSQTRVRQFEEIFETPQQLFKSDDKRLGQLCRSGRRWQTLPNQTNKTKQKPDAVQR